MSRLLERTILPVLVVAALLTLVCVTPANAHEIICRTPGFWGTHAGTEKPGSQNITQAVISLAGGALWICGDFVTNTALGSPYSALEKMCVSPQGEQIAQLRRQLTAMALNCEVSGGGNDCSFMPSELATLFATCNSACAANNAALFASCIARIDCFNNGGLWQNGVCLAVLNGCAQQPLRDTEPPQPFNFEPPGPAGSSNACNAAIANGNNP